MSDDEERWSLQSERAGMEDLLQSREQDIEELNAEIKELKWESYAAVEQRRESSKKICPFMTQATVTACRNDCIAWDNEFGCVIMDSYKAVAHEWRYKE